jgi:hypothetical protein
MSALGHKQTRAVQNVMSVRIVDIAVLKVGRAVVCWEDVTQVDAIQQSGTGMSAKNKILATYDKSFE